MNIPALKTIADTALDFAVSFLRTKGDLSMMFHLVRRDGTMEIIGTEGWMADSPKAKYAISQAIRRKVAAGDIEAVIIVSAVDYADISEENMRIKEANDWTIPEAAAHGLCTTSEAIMVLLESPDYWRMTRQLFQFVDGQVVLGQRIEEERTDLKEGQGRMFGWFGDAKAGQA